MERLRRCKHQAALDCGGAAYAGTFGARQAPATNAALWQAPVHKKAPGWSRGFFVYVLAKFAGLFLQYHLLNASVFTACHPVEIHTGGERSAGAVTAIPEDAVITGCVVAVLKTAH